MIFYDTTFELYMWISFYCFLFAFSIILSAKLIQFFRRWGESTSPSLEYKNSVIYITIENKTIPLNATLIKPKSSQSLKKILLISPFTVSAKRYMYLATAIALNNYEIVLIESRLNIRKIQKEKIDGQQFGTELVKLVSPDAVIASDVFFPLFFPEMEQETGVRYAYLRPILSSKEQSFLASLLLSIPGISSILRIIKNPLKDQERGKLSSISNKVLCIFPTSFLRKHRSNTSYGNLTIRELRSRYSFRNKETLVFALILRFIGEVSS